MSRSSLAGRLAALTTMAPAELQAAWTEAYEAPCPHLAPALLRLGIAYRLQEQQHGGLPATARRELERYAEGAEPARREPSTSTIHPGTRLVRTWQGRTISVEIVEGGFEWEGRIYASLSSIAKAVTGAHWSGPRFFGLTGAGRG